MRSAPDDIARWIKENRGLIFYWVRRRPSKHIFRTDDAYAAALAGVAKAIRNFDPERGCSFNTLVSWCMRGEITDEAVKIARRHAREKPVPIKADITTKSFEEWIESIPDPRLPKALAKLPERHQAVIRMRFFEGMDCPSIAAILGVSYQRIHQIERKALERLRYEFGIKEAV